MIALAITRDHGMTASSKYETFYFGTPYGRGERADSVVMANHGLVVVGRSLKEAYERTVKIEVKAGKLLGRHI